MSNSHWIVTLGLCTMSLMKTLLLTAQDIAIRNPSIEGPPKAGSVPAPWLRAFQSPDTQPGVYGITLAASDGKTYMGGIYGTKYMEGISQQLPTPLKAGTAYQVSFDLAAPAKYDTLIMCGGSMAIYGSNKPDEQQELLWSSGPFSHEEWKRYVAVLKPTKDYNYIVLMPNLPGTCAGSRYTACLIDNLSPALTVIPDVSFRVQPTCSGKSTGNIKVIVNGGKPPFTFQWSHNNALVQDSIGNLSAGDYEVTVTSASGTSTKSMVRVNEYVVNVTTTLTPPSCYGNKNGIIEVKATDGLSPYKYSRDNGIQFQDHPVFEKLKAGNYSFLVNDRVGCEARSQAILSQPAPLEVEKVNVKDVSCSDTRDGRIQLNISGGTQPYSFSIDQVTWQTDNSFGQLDAGNYRLLIKDQHNCLTETISTIKRNIRECAVFVPTAFSPNGDGQNDLFRAKVHDDVHDYRLDVFTRWGQTVFSTNSPDGAWDGLFKGQQLPTATYVWVLLYTDSKQQARKQTGTVMLIR